MFGKPALLTLVVTAVFTAAAWSTGAIDLDAACADRSDSPKEKPELHRAVVGGQVLDSDGDGSSGSAQVLRFPYDMLDESRMH
jgi:hypothetical protein